MIRLPHILVVILTISCAFNVFAQENTKQSSLAVLVDYNSEGKDLAEKLQLLLEEEVTLQWLGQFVKFSDFNKLLQELKISASGIEDKVNKSILINQTIKLAIIADKTSGLDNSLLVSLLEMELSQTEGIQVLERAQIDKILREQQLSISGLLDRDTILKVGRLLRADALVILSAEGENNEAAPRRPMPRDETDEIAEGTYNQDLGKLIRLRVVETAHGLRLCDSFEQLSEAELEQNSDRILNKIKDVVSKLSLPAGKAIPVGIVDIHRVQLSERYKLLERALPVMLSVRLGREPRIIMLEREDLNLLQKEKILTEGQDTEFWGSAVLIDGYIQPNGIDTIELKLQLRQSAGNDQTSLTVPVDPNQPSIAIDLAANKIIKNLQNSPPSTQWQPEKEALEFHRQGQLLSVNKKYEDALAPLETATALEPKNVLYMTTLFANEWNARFHENGSYYFNGTGLSFYSDQELAELISVLVRQIKYGYEKNQISASEVLNTLGGMIIFEDNLWGYFTSSASTSTETIRNINRLNRNIWMETIHKALREHANWKKQAEAAWVSSDVPEEIIANVRETFAQAIVSLPYRNQHSNLKKMLYTSPIRPFFDPRELEKTYLGASTNRCWRLWCEYLEELTEVGNPVLQFLSSQYLLNYLSMEIDNIDREKLEKFRLKTISILKNKLNTPNEPFAWQVKWDIRRGIRGFMTITEFAEICKPLIAKQDAENLALWEPGNQPCPIYNPEITISPITNVSDSRLTLEMVSVYYQLLEQIAIVLQSHHEDIRIMKALNQIIDTQMRLRDSHPQLNKRQRPMNLPVTMLIKEEDWPHEVINEKLTNLNSTHGILQGFDIQVKLQENVLWIAFLEYPLYSKSQVGLAGIDLIHKKYFLLYHMQVPYSLIHRLYQLNGMEILGNTIFVPQNRGGLIAQPFNSTKVKQYIQNPTVLTEEDGLPSVSITSMSADGNQLWIAYGGPEEECGLGLYDPDTKHWETVFCSTINGRPPFNSGYPYEIYSLMPVSPDKLYFLVIEPQQAKGVGNKIPDGLWKLDKSTREVEYIGYIWNRSPWLMNAEVSSDKLLFKFDTHLIEFDSNSETAKIIFGNPMFLKRGYSARRNLLPQLDYKFFIPSASLESLTVSNNGYDISSCAIHQGKMWARLGRSQIMVLHKGKTIEEAKVIDNDILDGEPVSRFVSTPYGLIAIGNGTVGLIETESD